MDTPEQDWLATPIARYVWENRYRWSQNGESRDADIEATWRRVARTAASREDRPAEWEERYYGILQGFRFLPAGRILAGIGTGRRVTLFNCFVMGPVRDDMEGIFDALKEGALTMQAGGGVGYDFSTLRPRGQAARATGRTSSGPVPFLGIWDAMCATLLSTGARRGAMIASLRCDHPDILDFVEAKHEAGRLTHFNLSVQISDAFMDAVAADQRWPLVFPAAALSQDSGLTTVERAWPGHEGAVPCRVLSELPARTLWDRIMRSAFETAEPGVLFVDRINRLNNLAYRETLTTTNPCGEVPLPPYGACNLGSLNLSRFVHQPFTSSACFDLAGLRAAAGVAARLLDRVIDCSEFPLPAQAEQAQGSRRVGLGITGLADALIMLGQHYANEAARRSAAGAMQTITEAAYRASVELARSAGPFPYFEREAYLDSPFLKHLPTDILDGIRKHGIRNSHLTAIAPAGTISLLANNVSSGIEPVFAFRVKRHVLGNDGRRETFELEDEALRRWRQSGHAKSGLPDCFVTANELEPAAHLAMQAVLQPWIDSAISKTVNVPADFSFEAFRDLYHHAYEQGLKGCTAFRPNPLRGEVLSPIEAQSAAGEHVHCCSIDRQGD